MSITALQTVQPMRPRDFTPSQLAVIKRTVAADCNDTEFDLFIAVCRNVGADPIRRHLHPVVYNKDDPEKRRMTIITSIDFMRATAGRNRDYRPDEDEATFEVDASIKGDANPAGLVKAAVRAFKFGPDREWHRVVGVAYWNEFAPMKIDGDFKWEETGEVYPPGHKKAGKPKYRKVASANAKTVPDGKWATMPHLMLAKCAEAQALRKGWPEDLSSIYTDEEMAQAEARDITASVEVQMHERDQRLARIGAKNTIAILWRAGEAIDQVPLGAMVDRCLEFFRKSENATELEWWWRTNEASIRVFWANHKSDGLAVKQAHEARKAELEKADVSA
jgi:phage recombination protein Bet